MKLEKFDLEKVIHGARVITRDGREVTQLSKFDTYLNLCLYGVVDDEVECWTIDGQYYPRGTSNMDLYIVAKVQSIWVNVYKNQKDGKISIGYNQYKSKDDAEQKGVCNSSYFKTIEITDEP